MSHQTKKQYKALIHLGQRFPDRLFWMDFLELYSRRKSYWYFPKGLTIKEDNIDTIKKRLAILAEQFFAERWDTDNQAKYCGMLEKQGLFEGRKETRTRQDYTARSRIQTAVFELLGLAYVEKDRLIYITDAGEVFLKIEDEEEGHNFLRKQLAKYQFYKQKGLSLVNPIILFLKILAKVDYELSEDEYKFFVNLVDDATDLKDTENAIRKWRRLSEDHKGTLIERVKNIHTIKDEVLAGYHVSDKSREITIRQNYPFQKSLLLFHYKGLVSEEDGKFIVHDQAEVKRRFDRIQKQFVPFDFKDKEDWYSFYGDSNRQPVAFELLKHKVETTTSKASSFKVKEQNKKLLEGLSEEEEKNLDDLIYEKEIEDFYSRHLYLLEKGLKLVKKGRQYSTNIGRIDLLCQDENGDHVVIEIKRGNAEDKAMGQILRYIGWVHQNLNDEGRTRGIVLSEGFSDKIQFARMGLLKPDAKTFIKFKEANLKPKEV